MKCNLKGLALAAGLAAATGGFLSTVAAADVTFITAQQPAEWMAHRLVGTKVLNAQADIVGDVNDVVVDANGTVSAIVIGVGGFLGVGDKDVAVPLKSIQIGEVVNGSRVVLLDVSKDALKAAPTYAAKDPTAADRLKQKASEWATAAKAKVLELTKKAQEKALELKKQAETPAPAPK